MIAFARNACNIKHFIFPVNIIGLMKLKRFFTHIINLFMQCEFKGNT